MRSLQAGEAGRVILVPNLKVDWDAAGYALKLLVTKEGEETTSTYNMSAVIGIPFSAKITTTTTMFPTAGAYKLQVVAYLAGEPYLRSQTVIIPVLPN